MHQQPTTKKHEHPTKPPKKRFTADRLNSKNTYSYPRFSPDAEIGLIHHLLLCESKVFDQTLRRLGQTLRLVAKGFGESVQMPRCRLRFRRLCLRSIRNHRLNLLNFGIRLLSKTSLPPHGTRKPFLKTLTFSEAPCSFSSSPNAFQRP